MKHRLSFPVCWYGPVWELFVHDQETHVVEFGRVIREAIRKSSDSALEICLTGGRLPCPMGLQRPAKPVQGVVESLSGVQQGGDIRNEVEVFQMVRH